ncbi:MAG: hypothetical protein HC836_50395 [Richelia sp. RM2_1_2]|nr:hypothetical protein [Richelia sp. RM2_1_2]
MIRPCHVTILSLLILFFPLLGMSTKGFSHTNSNNTSIVEELFTNIDSPGNIAICKAEGNCDDNGKFTSLYYGHIDPSKLGGKRVLNQGFCSDYGKSKAGDIDGANKGCLRRIQSRLPRLTKLFQQQNIDIAQHKTAFINAVDLWNQASPKVSDNFPQVYADNIRKGLSIDNAIRRSRIDAFNLSADGLFNICAREPYYISRLANYLRHSTDWKRNCIDLDQNRRRLAINSVLTNRGVK